jgi:hypothetical protein
MSAAKSLKSLKGLKSLNFWGCSGGQILYRRPRSRAWFFIGIGLIPSLRLSVL